MASRLTIPPSEPGPVRRLTVTPAGSNSLTVEWQEPGDDPPKGTLESFKVFWGEKGKQSTDHLVIWARNNRYRRKYTARISGLNSGTEYWVKIQAKNKDVQQYGAATNTTATTGMGNVVEDLQANGTQSSLALTWRPPSSKNSVTSWYSVLLYDANNVLQQNISADAPQAKLEGLSDSQQYLAKVAACNDTQCGPDEELTCWTRPAKPSLQETVNLVAASDTTITILMPLLSNPPGKHTVAVQREGREPPTQDWQDALRRRAEALVEDGPARPTLSPKQLQDGDTMYIAAQVEQEGDERVTVTVGDGTSAGHIQNPALQKGAAYWLVVVTEKRSGAEYVERVVGAPGRFVARSSNFPAWIVGQLVVLALLAVVAAMVAVYRRQCRAKLTPRRGHSLAVDTPGSLQQPADAPLPMVPINAGKRNSSTEAIYDNATLEVKVQDIEAYLLRAGMSMETRIEYQSVPPRLITHHIENSRPENTRKNRYSNEVVYDDTRVILPLHEQVPHSDYINANYVQGPTQNSVFIAAEGPLQGTIGAFWRMVWHFDCPAILMLANLMEENKVKVAQYWREERPLSAEGIEVTLTAVTVKMDFVIRTFSLSTGTAKKEVSQYQYTAWPDHGVPNMPYGLAQMIKEVRKENIHHKPVVVHCSDGIGRTGTVLLVMYLLDELQERGAINPVKALRALRNGRGMLVENAEQYVFAHQVLHEILVGTDSSYQCHAFQECLTALQTQLSSTISSPLHMQYQKLLSLPKDLDFRHGKNPACAHLNRHPDILPADSRLVTVSSEDGIDAEYVNVIRINTVDTRDAYLAGEHPQAHTLHKVWRLVYERRVPVWVLLHVFPDADPEFPEVTRVSAETLDNMTLTVGPTQTFQNFYERQVDITVKSLGQVSTHKCVLLSLRGWPAADCLPATPEPLLAVIERMEALCSQEQPPLFTCKDGVTGCGVMAALLVAISRTKLMQHVDIYRSVASVQQDRPQFVVNLDQYIFLHNAMADFLSSSSHYKNFT